MFRVSTTPIIRSTQNCNYCLRYYAATSLQRGQASLATLERGSCIVPEAIVTVLCTPDDGCGWYPKHVVWTCRIINRLLCVASRWTVINICLNVTSRLQKHYFSVPGITKLHPYKFNFPFLIRLIWYTLDFWLITTQDIPPYENLSSSHVTL